MIKKKGDIMMRTRKEIRKAHPLRRVIGIVFIILSLIMYILGYLALEFRPHFIEVLRTASMFTLVIISIIWFSCATLLLLGGYLIRIGQRVRHHEYVDRPYTSSVK